jgi:hypothetical protein
LTEIPKFNDAEIIASLIHNPETRKLAEAARARKVAARRECADRITSLDAEAEAAWPKLSNAIEIAKARVKAAEVKLRDANDQLAVAVHARSAASWSHTNSRREAEIELIDGAEMELIGRFREWLNDEREKTYKRSAIVSVSGIDRNSVTAKTIRTGANNLASIRAWQAAIASALERADLLALEPDQSRVPELIEGIRATLPPVDMNPRIEKAASK